MIKRKSLLLILFFSIFASADNFRFALFPLTNEKSSSLNDWLRYAIPELCNIKLNSLSGINVLNPVSIFQIDSTEINIENDSLLIRHKNRWEWDVAVGGSFKISGDTLKTTIKVFWTPAKKENLRMELNYTSKVEDFDTVSTALVLNVLTLLKHKMNHGDTTLLRKEIFGDRNAFQTYALGLGFEMHGDYNSAVTAYHRAIDIDSDLALAWCRLSGLYSKNGKYDLALKGFQKIDDCKFKDNNTIADAADFMIEKMIPSVATRYIESHRTTLEKTAKGQAVLGKEYLSLGEYQRALASLTKALASEPSSIDIQYTLGTAYLIAGEYNKASDFFNELIKYNPHNLRYYSSLGAAYRNSGRLMESSMILEAALKIDPDNTTILIDLAHTYFKLKWFQKARQLLLHAITVDPKLDIAYVNLGVVYWLEGKKDDAKRNFEYAAKVPVSRRASLNNLGNIFFLEEKYRSAIKIFKKADKYGKKNAIVQYNIATSYQKIGRLKKAVYHFDELLRLNPERIDILLQAASLAEKLHRLTDAENYYHKVLQIYPYHRGAINNYVRLLCLSKRHGDAVKPVETYLEHFPTDKDMLVLICKIYYEMGWYEVALMKYNFIIRDFPESSEGYCGVAKCMYNMVRFKNASNYDQVIYALKIASDHASDDPEPDLLTGDIYLDFKHYKELALEHYEKALLRSNSEKQKREIQSKIINVKNHR